MKCKQCGYDNPSEAEYCENCGEKLPSERHTAIIVSVGVILLIIAGLVTWLLMRDKDPADGGGFLGGQQTVAGMKSPEEVEKAQQEAEEALEDATKEAGLPALETQTVEEDLKNNGMTRQYNLRVDYFEIINVYMDPGGRRQVVSCRMTESNDYCTAEETADISYSYDESAMKWYREHCSIKSKKITPKSNPTDDDIRAKVRANPHYDDDANLDVEIVSKGNVDGDPCAYYANARTVTPPTERNGIRTYVETTEYTVNYSFTPASGWSGNAAYKSSSREVKVKTSLSGHYEGRASAEDADISTQLGDISYSFDLTVSEDGKDIVLSNVYIGGYPNPYPVTNQQDIPQKIQDGSITFKLSNPEGTESNIHVGNVTVGYLDDMGAIAIFDVARLYPPEYNHEQYVWGRHITFTVSLHL